MQAAPRGVGGRLAGLLVLALATAAAPLAAAELDEAVQASLAMRPAGAIRVIVQLEEAPALDEHRAALQPLPAPQRPGALAQRLRGAFMQGFAPLVQRLAGIGAQDIQPLWIEHALALEMPRSRVREVAGWPGVRRIESDVALRAPHVAGRGHPGRAARQDEQVRAALGRVAAAAPGTFAVPTPGQAAWQLTEHLAALDAPRAWAAGLDGRGTTVAVVDSGVDLRVPALAAAYRAGAADWFDPYAQHRLPHDALGHGTLVASLLVGRPAAGEAPTAVAPAARFVAARLFDDAGHGRLSAVHRIYQWLLDPDGDERTHDAPQVVNNSWGLAGTTDRCNLRLVRVWQAMALADVAVVFAAGNDGPHERTSMSPANNPGVISVGALDAEGAVARQSSRGPSACDATGAEAAPFPTLHAPGIALPALDRIGASTGVVHRSDGTSFAAAVASGALLLLRQQHPQWSVDQLLQVLNRAARAAAPGRPPGVHLAALAAATDSAAQVVRPTLALQRPDSGRLDAHTLRPVLPRAVGPVSLAAGEGARAEELTFETGSAQWQPTGNAEASIDLIVELSDGTRQPLRVTRPAIQAATPAAEPRVLTGRRDTPVDLDAAAAAPGASPAATGPEPAGAGDPMTWSQPLRGGRIERDAQGRWWYRPPAGFVGTDQFALRTPQGPQVFRVVVRP